MDSDDTAFFSEVLALLADSDDGESSGGHQTKPPLGTGGVDHTTRRPPEGRAKTSAPGTKETILSLRVEATQLTEALTRLRGAQPVVAMESALAERRKRKRAERDCHLLREAVYQQTQFMRGLESIFSVRPQFSLRLNLCRYLHQHVRLPRDRTLRWGDFDPVSHDERLLSAKHVLCRETESLARALQGDAASPSLVTPLFHCEPVDDVGLESMTATSVYTVPSSDVAAVARGVCVAVRDLVTLCPSGHSLTVARDIVDVDAASARNILYRVMGIRHRNVASGTDVELESHVVTSYKVVGDDHAVVLWDFVDDDQLHPPTDATNITREITGACLIRRELCEDSVERTVIRSLCTKRYRYHTADAPQRYGCITQETMHANEKLFQKIVQEQLAAEEALAARARVSHQDRQSHGIEAGCGCQLG